jgi:cobalamin biosynthesis protein CobD/CbiB
MEESRKPRCIICNEQKDGLGIKPDAVVGTLRWLNGHTFKYKNPYRPVVCRGCFLKYRKSRATFERKRAIYLVIGIVFAIVLVLASKGNAYSLLAGLGVIAFMYLLSLINYVPELDMPQKTAVNAAAGPAGQNPKIGRKGSKS